MGERKQKNEVDETLEEELERLSVEGLTAFDRVISKRILEMQRRSETAEVQERRRRARVGRPSRTRFSL